MDGRRPVIGVMGAGDASASDEMLAEELGRLIAQNGWALLTGGRDAGIMRAAMKGAKSVPGSLTIGILPSAYGGASPFVDVAIFTNMGDARNAINVLSSDVVIVCGKGGAGTASEAALALKSGKPVVLLQAGDAAERYFGSLSASIHIATTVQEAIRVVSDVLQRSFGDQR